MTGSSLPRRAAIAVACLGATAAVGTAPALAAVPGENIFGSGSSLQKIAQQNVWTGTWSATAADHSQLSNDPTATYFSSSSGNGLAEFGNTTGALDLTKDTNADNGSTNGYGVPVLDAYIGTDDPPTGPVGTSGTNLNNAMLAATGSATTPVQEITVPVTQAPVAVLISLPSGITAGNGTTLKLKNALLQEIWNAAVPKTKDYAANTFGALLEWAGLKRVASAPAAQQFTDAGGSTGGPQTITLQVRTGASGTSYAFKGFLNLSGDSLYTSAFVVDDPTWPVTTHAAGSGGSDLVNTTTSSPGSVGYANLADAATATPGYTKTVQSTTAGGSAHQILYASIQDNQGGTGFVYADPQGSVAGSANVYTGNNININGANPNFVGHWNVPLTGSTLDPTGAWGGTQASDPDVYDHSIQSGKKQVKYPIVAATYDVAWTRYDQAHSNVVSKYGGTTAQATAAGNAARSYLKYLVGAAAGQADLANAALYYGRLPAKIGGYASTAVNHIVP